jgi:DNA-binding response OmpR family regulator
LGYTVYECADGREAVDLFRERAEGIDLVLLDLVMPRMSGEEAFREMRRIRPGVPILLASGHAEDKAAAALLQEGACGFLAKPFTLSELSLRVARHLLLAAPRGSGG